MTKEKILKIAVPIIATFFVVIAVYAGSTIGSNISTDGNLTVTGTTGLTGLLTFTRATSTSATSTGYLMVGVPFSMPPGFNYDADLAVSGDAVINNKATSTVALWVGSAGTADKVNLTGGDLYVQDGAEIDGNLWIGGSATTSGYFTSLGVTSIFATGTAATTTPGVYVFGNTGTATTTFGVGSLTQKGCIELSDKTGVIYRIIVDSGVLNVQSGRCN